MEPSGYLILTLATAMLLLCLGPDVRAARRCRIEVNTRLRAARCPQCGAAYREWKGAVSRNHYSFVAPAEIDLVLEVVCSNCEAATDAFWRTDRTLFIEHSGDAGLLGIE